MSNSNGIQCKKMHEEIAKHENTTGGSALVVYVKPKEAFRETNPEKPAWLEALDVELQALFDDFIQDQDSI